MRSIADPLFWEPRSLCGTHPARDRLSVARAKDREESTSTIYEIKLKGHVDDRWAGWFYDLTITRESDGTSTLCGPNDLVS